MTTLANGLSTAAPASAGSLPYKVSNGILKPFQDRREYKYLVLPNRLHALLIHDAHTDKGAAAMDVRVGNFQDSKDLAGLAHFLEHMLFLGTEKYPEEGSYNAFLSSHGGASNAYTAGQSTNYYFDISHNYLEQALDRFSQFFISPLFTETATFREMQAVDSEHKKNLQQDVWRVMQFVKSLANEAHPFHKFGTGDLTTLKDEPAARGVDVRSELLKFHDAFYSSNIMKLVVLGRDSLEVQEEWVRQMFSAIPDKNLVIPTTFGVPAFSEAQLQQRHLIVPVIDQHTLDIIMPVPPMRPYYRSKPNHYLSHLIGHEGPGSILSLLKSKGWADGLSAGDQQESSDFSMFHISVTLTEEGVDHAEEIVEVVFRYINLLKKQDVQRWIYEEVKSISDMHYRFAENQVPIKTVTALASNMQHYASEHVLAAPHILFDYDPDLVRETLRILDPKNMSYLVISKKCTGKTDKTEKIYGTNYSSSNFPAGWVQKVASLEVPAELHLPFPNLFIPTDFSLPEVEAGMQQRPVRIGNNERYTLWYKHDNVFKVPKANVMISLITSNSCDSPAANVMKDLFVHLVGDALNEYAYAAEIAGLRYQYAIGTEGLQIEFLGYHHKLAVLAETVLERVARFDFTQERFDLVKASLARRYNNFRMEQPYQHALYTCGYLLRQNRWHYVEYSDALNAINAEEVRAFIPKVLSLLRFEALVHGSLTPSNAIALLDLVCDTLSSSALPVSQILDRRVVSLPVGVDYIYRMQHPNPEEVNSAIDSYYQVGVDFHNKCSVLVQLMGQILDKPFFHQLRTVEQLGYIVFSGTRRELNVVGARFLLQSSNKDAARLDERVEDFIVQFEKELANMPAEEFKDHVDALIAKKSEKDHDLHKETVRHWGEIVSHQYIFNRVEVECELLRGLTHTEMREFFHTTFVNKQTRRKLCVQVFGKAHPVDNVGTVSSSERLITSPFKFKRSLAVFESGEDATLFP